MSRFSDLVKGFRYNVKNGYPTTLTSTGWHIYLTCDHNKGYVGSMKDVKHREVEDDLPDILSYENTGIPRPEF